LKVREKILVTGGAGYIGSHTVQQLVARGDSVIVLDNLSTGFRQAVPAGVTLVEGDVGDERLVGALLREHGIRSVVHFAAHCIVPESMTDPLKYYTNNTAQTCNLIAACVAGGVQHFVFSSTCAVYGMVETPTADELATLAPINPYGSSKLMSEWMLRDVAPISGMRFVVLRYFNVAGGDPQGRIGQSTRRSTLLVKVACEASVGKRPGVSIFGTDYPTPDGTGVRDYIHVVDLADAHLLAVDYLLDGGESQILNCGYGHGYSVREVLDSVQRVSGAPLNISEMPRRAGDPPYLVARADRIRQVLGWKPRLDNLDGIVTDSLNWERQQQKHPW
jgi:UDP-glucose 4-epimerase